MKLLLVGAGVRHQKTRIQRIMCSEFRKKIKCQSIKMQSGRSAGNSSTCNICKYISTDRHRLIKYDVQFPTY